MTTAKDKHANTADKYNLKSYDKPELSNPGSLAELTEGFSGSIPDEQGGQTKRNPFAG
ncbi:putative RiPP precursor [Ningiella sp. W23]|uniref:putative RiPP precursor n=1 Tax=Ningiella sp. W23 TaxID=3023715 RepID=UPI003756AD82